MRWILIFLVAVNIALGGYVFLQETRPNPDAQIISLQMNEDKVRIIPEPPRPQKKRADTLRTACLDWGSFDVQELRRVREALSEMKLGDRLSSRDAEVTAKWWVYMPRQRTRVRMERKADELRQIGVTDFITIPKRGRWQYAISLGAFRKEVGARNYLRQLSKLGVRTAVVGPREQEITQTTLTIRTPTPAESRRLSALATQFPGSDMGARECSS